MRLVDQTHAPGPVERAAGRGPLAWLIAVLALSRLVYHLLYLRDVPFAVATLSDGRIYERAAADLVAHPPLGTEPFYLQGLYAVQLALPMALGGLALALLVQILLAGAAWWVLHRAMRAMFGAKTAAWGLALALAHPPLAFYENKFLSASLTVVCSIAVVAAFAWAERSTRLVPSIATGLAIGLAMLARPNLALAVPFCAVALVSLDTARRRRAAVLGGFGLGVVLALAPMAWRNAAVTGAPTVFPAHGGGTSFYIGNNARANGVWNDAGLFSGDVAREADEFEGIGVVLGDEPGDPRRAAQMGEALYRRAWTEIAEDPGRWVWLLARKGWLMIGNDELSQDYDVLGEQEMIPWANRVGVPFGVLAALAALGLAQWWHAPEQRARVWLVVGLAGATVASNVVFFTSAQHRLPLAIPMVILAATGVQRAWVLARDRVALRVGRVSVAVAALLCMQALWPRTSRREPSAVHYYNLSLAFDHVGEPKPAMAAIERALARAPDQPLMLLHRAMLLRRAGDYAGAQADLDRIATIEGVPDWVRDHAMLEAESVAWGIAAAAPP